MRKLFRHSYAIIVVIAVITVFFAAMLPRIVLDNDVLSFIPDDHPAHLDFERLDDLYETDLTIAVGVENPHGEILTTKGVDLIAELTSRFEEIADAGDVQSLTNIDYIAGTSEGMEVEELGADYDGTQSSLDEIRRRVRSWQAYDGALVSDDFHSSMIIVNVDGDLDDQIRERIHSDVVAIVGSTTRPVITFTLPVNRRLTVLISDNMRADIITMVPMVILVVVGSLYFFFRRFGGVFLPMITVLVSTVWTVGLMALLGVKFSLVGTIIPF